MPPGKSPGGFSVAPNQRVHWVVGGTDPHFGDGSGSGGLQDSQSMLSYQHRGWQAALCGRWPLEDLYRYTDLRLRSNQRLLLALAQTRKSKGAVHVQTGPSELSSDRSRMLHRVSRCTTVGGKQPECGASYAAGGRGHPRSGWASWWPGRTPSNSGIPKPEADPRPLRTSPVNVPGPGAGLRDVRDAQCEAGGLEERAGERTLPC